MKKVCILLLYSFIATFNITCAKKNESIKSQINSSPIEQQQDCEKNLYKLFYTSDFESKDKYDIRVEDIRNDTIIIKTFVRNNLSDNPQIKQVVESVIEWFIIPPKHDGVYLSLNALDPIDPKFRKLKIKDFFFK